MRAAFESRRDMAVHLLDGTPGVEFFRPSGTFYLFPRVEEILRRAKGGTAFATDADLVNWLLDRTGAATVAGSAFSAPGHLRLSFAADEKTLSEGITLIRAALTEVA